ncbi:hypothetical protein SNEBB_011475 [Seison nebaliae]|nr:hypothetical protein SNEBB_011475 [Seison nebaliae]
MWNIDAYLPIILIFMLFKYSPSSQISVRRDKFQIHPNISYPVRTSVHTDDPDDLIDLESDVAYSSLFSLTIQLIRRKFQFRQQDYDRTLNNRYRQRLKRLYQPNRHLFQPNQFNPFVMRNRRKFLKKSYLTAKWSNYPHILTSITIYTADMLGRFVHNRTMLYVTRKIDVRRRQQEFLCRMKSTELLLFSPQMTEDLNCWWVQIIQPDNTVLIINYGLEQHCLLTENHIEDGENDVEYSCSYFFFEYSTYDLVDSVRQEGNQPIFPQQFDGMNKEILGKSNDLSMVEDESTKSFSGFIEWNEMMPTDIDKEENIIDNSIETYKSFVDINDEVFFHPKRIMIRPSCKIGRMKHLTFGLSAMFLFHPISTSSYFRWTTIYTISHNDLPLGDFINLIFYNSPRKQILCKKANSNFVEWKSHDFSSLPLLPHNCIWHYSTDSNEIFSSYVNWQAISKDDQTIMKRKYRQLNNIYSECSHHTKNDCRTAANDIRLLSQRLSVPLDLCRLQVPLMRRRNRLFCTPLKRRRPKRRYVCNKWTLIISRSASLSE